MKKSPIELVDPSKKLLPGYADALRKGWSPNTIIDVSADELAAVEADPRAFLDDLTANRGTIKHADGSETERLPSRLFWISDGEFCGSIGLRFERGTEELPPFVPGHIGYTIVPWKQRRGYATAALGLILPVARAEGLARVTVSCDADNVASEKVIVSNGGVLIEEVLRDAETGKPKLVFRITT
ncbi:MAG TPA: GNAT family N-acetyltransferase [Parvibaculum sp.]